MADQSLVSYIKQNLANGFSEGEVRQALRRAGWPEQDITDSFAIAKNQLAPQTLTGGLAKDKNFVAQNSKKIITALVVLVFFPILGIGGFFLYQNFGPNGSRVNTPPTGEVAGERTSNVEPSPVAAEELQKRDVRRLTDVSDTQKALESYFERYQTYPQKLSDLVNEGLLGQIPKDPKNDTPYLYTTFGEPALYYSLAWILESDIGTLAKGLHTASSENMVPVQDFLAQQSVILGETEKTSEALATTDLSVIPFYPQEEVTLEVAGLAGGKLASVILIVENSYINLVDTKAPFGFRFTAPQDTGQYTVNIYAFDELGTSFFQKTTLTVK